MNMPNTSGINFRNLTPRCREVLQRLLHGDADKLIAQKLGISIHTVHIYVRDLYRQYGVAGRTELTSLFISREVFDELEQCCSQTIQCKKDQFG